MIGIVGPTASGKSYVAKILSENGYFIINADSQQIYKEFEILKSTPNNLHNHYLYSKYDHSEKITAFQYLQDLNNLIMNLPYDKICIVGGTGLYFKLIMNGISDFNFVNEEVELEVVKKYLNEYYPEVLNKFQDYRRLKKAYLVLKQTGKKILEYNNIKIIQQSLKLYSLVPERKIVINNIQKRLELDFEKMIEEVKSNLNYEKLDIIGYDLIKNYLKNNLKKEECYNQILIKTRQYSKRQVTYINNNLNITEKFNSYEKIIKKILKN